MLPAVPGLHWAGCCGKLVAACPAPLWLPLLCLPACVSACFTNGLLTHSVPTRRAWPADATGAEIERALVATARANPAIHFFEHHLATDLLSEWRERFLLFLSAAAYSLGSNVLRTAF